MIEGPEIEHHHHTNHRWLDMVIGCTAVFLSCVSVFIAIHHGQTMEKLVAANSWPSVTYGTSNSDDAGTNDDITLDITNNGVGPARIDTLQLFYKGSRQASFPALMRTCCDAKGKKLSYGMSVVVDDVLPARETTHFIRLSHKANPELWPVFDRERMSVDVLACYCSVFEECWISDTRTRRPKRVEQCSQPESDNFMLR